ncbi:hypothetical protein [Aurantibacter sp.]|uniref:hypothetical protein n=1 Tax=Aurantibacter sp. TaxID=2807103 RepID=UPI003262FBEE
MKKFAVILVFILALFSCTKENVGVINTELEGKWILTNAACYCNFDENVDFGTHQITFLGSRLDVENSAETKFLTNADGEYSVEGNIIVFDSGAQFSYVVNNDKLELTAADNPQIADDELVLSYEKY